MGSSRKRPPLHEMAPRPKEIGDNQTQATFEPNQSPARGGVRVGVLPLRHAGTSGDDSHLGP
ncbi:MAG: hypothetical protein QOG73_3619, partial [Acetobacteraceae bacterium]|nr:hypothetical protein [Acetobacteraceae bacterium]